MRTVKLKEQVTTDGVHYFHMSVIFSINAGEPNIEQYQCTDRNPPEDADLFSGALNLALQYMDEERLGR
jgi:hypothetical protein